MLKLKYRYTNFDLAKRALENWEYDSSSLEDMLRRFHITANAIYPFACNGRVQFLRLAPVEEKSLTNLQGELAFIVYLIQNKFPALEPVKMKNGKILTMLETEWGKYYAAAFRSVPGVQVSATDYSADVMYQYGKTLGRLHALSAVYQPRVRKQSYEDVLAWIAQVFQHYEISTYAPQELNVVKQLLAGLPKTQQNFGLVHYDFTPDNVFYDIRTRTCAVIDFDDAMYHWYALDVTQVLVSLATIMKGNPQKFATARDKFLRGYKSEYYYTAEIVELMPIMQRFINLYTYARLVRSVAEKLPNEPDWMFTLRGEMNRMIKEKETYFQPK